MATTTPRRTPSNWRNMLEVRVRRLAASKPPDVRREALVEIRDLAQQALDQHDADHPQD